MTYEQRIVIVHDNSMVIKTSLIKRLITKVEHDRNRNAFCRLIDIICTGVLIDTVVIQPIYGLASIAMSYTICIITNG